MQREIKFRAKQGKIIQHFPIKYGLTDWIYGWLHCSFDGSFFTYISNINDEKMETETFAVESSTVCQFTGCKDKNGKEIYEGDIFHLGDINIKYVVEWLDCGLKARQLNNKSCVGIEYWKKNIEVIGNIIDNPEYLR